MSESDTDLKKSSGGSTASGTQRTVNAILGIIVLLLIVVLINFVFNRIKHRVDLTENNIYTLTDGTKDVLERVKELGNPVVLRYYAVTDPDYVSQFYLTRAAAVEDFLKEYENRAGGLISVRRYNPEPYSDDAERAKDVEKLPQGFFDNAENPVYFGLVVECEGRVEKLDFIPARQEELLEYDITRAILRVADTERKKIGVMTAMDIAGGPPAGFGQPPAPKWYLIRSLEKDYDVEILPPTTSEVPADVDVLLVLHPYDAGEEAQYAIDQYLLKGGRVLVTVDPMFFAARYMTPNPGGNPMMMQQGPMGPAPQSDLESLFQAWGVSFDETKVLADVAAQTRLQTGYAPTVLSVPESAMNDEDPVTSQLSDLFMITPGALEVQPKEGIESTVLVSTSTESQLVGVAEADPTSRQQVQDLRRNFKPDGKERALVVRLSGTFSSAFPNGLNSADPGDGAMPDFGSLPGPGDAPPVPEPAEPIVPDDPEEDAAPSPSDADADAKPDDAAADPADSDKPAGTGDAPAAPEDGDASTPAPAVETDGGAGGASEASENADAEPDGDSAADGGADAGTEDQPETGGPEEDESDPTAAAAAEGADAASDSEATPASASLKTSEKEGVVVVFADTDFVYDSFAAQQMQNMENGRVEMRPVNGNLALFENAVEQLAGGDSLIRVRSRASNLRPFTRLNEILEGVEQEYRKDLTDIASEMQRIESERGMVEQNIMRILSRTAAEDGVIKATPELTAEIEKLQEQQDQMQEQMKDWEKKQYDVNKAIKREFESEKNSIILLVTFLLPGILVVVGVALWVMQRVRTAAQ